VTSVAGEPRSRRARLAAGRGAGIAMWNVEYRRIGTAGGEYPNPLTEVGHGGIVGLTR